MIFLYFYILVLLMEDFWEFVYNGRVVFVGWYLNESWFLRIVGRVLREKEIWVFWRDWGKILENFE